ncbi:MAG TPA: IS630 family transposase [Desulfuromonadaceae bacterium]|jgi:transposase
METMMVKYASELELIKKEPDYNRIRAMKHFFLLKDFENRFLPLQREQHTEKVSRSKAVTAYCEFRGIPIRSFYRWIVLYREHGIKGLVPKYGQGTKQLYRCQKNKLIATIPISIKNPLKCLETLRKIIQRCTLIQPETKQNSLFLLKQYFTGLQAGCRLRLRTPLTEDELKTLRRYKAGKHRWHTKRAAVILMADEGRTLVETMRKTRAPIRSIYRWLRNFNKDGMESIEVHIHQPAKEKEMAERQTRVIDIIHKMPSLYGINRTTWTYGAIAEAYQKEYGEPISVGKLYGVVRNSNYSWRHARKVLTSPDPDYKEKVEKLLDTLQGLKEGERFFFIDEVGPYRVKKYDGSVLIRKDQTPPTVPEFQKNKGKIQFVAALEAITNQLTWLFTPDKGADSMVKLLQKLVKEYASCPAAYLTWDAISVHNSKVVTDWIQTHNKTALKPHIKVIPLPSNAQFLNVIESVFGGMKKAIICNSDYDTPHDMQEAISKHFNDRNVFYRENPKRAGNKIWDKQGFDFDKLAGGLFKKM